MFALGNFLLFKYLGFVYYMDMDLNLHSLKYLLSMFVLLTRYVRLDKQQKCIPRSSRGYQIFWSPHWGLCQLALGSEAQVYFSSTQRGVSLNMHFGGNGLKAPAALFSQHRCSGCHSSRQPHKDRGLHLLPIAVPIKTSLSC